MNSFLRGLCAVGGLLLATTVQAQDFPSQPFTIIMPNAPGGSAEFTARLVADGITRETGQPVAVVSKPGGGGNIGAETAARADPDGYTLFMGYAGTNSVNIHVFKQLQYDPVKDFEPISLLWTAPYYLYINPSVPADSIQELIDYAKANPDTLAFGSSGVGGPSHMAIELFNLLADVDILHVPYKAAAQSVQDMVSGRIQGQFTTASRAMPLVEDGQLKVLGVTSKTASEEFPQFPPIADTLPEYEFLTWQGLLVPANTPEDRIAKLNEIIRKVLTHPDLVEKYKNAGIDPAPSSPEEFAEFMRVQTDLMGRIVKAAGIEPQ